VTEFIHNLMKYLTQPTDIFGKQIYKPKLMEMWIHRDRHRNNFI